MSDRDLSAALEHIRILEDALVRCYETLQRVNEVMPTIDATVEEAASLLREALPHIQSCDVPALEARMKYFLSIENEREKYDA